MQFTNLVLIAAAAVTAAPTPSRGSPDNVALGLVGNRNSAFMCYQNSPFTDIKSCEAVFMRCRNTVSFCGTVTKIVYIPYGI